MIGKIRKLAANLVERYVLVIYKIPKNFRIKWSRDVKYAEVDSEDSADEFVNLAEIVLDQPKVCPALIKKLGQRSR